MIKLEHIILADLFERALKAGRFVQVLRKEKYFFETFYVPEYLSHNFEGYPLDELAAVCTRLAVKGYIDYMPGAYIRLMQKGAEHIEQIGSDWDS